MDEVPKEAQQGSLAHLPRFLPAIFTTFRRLLLWDSTRRCLLVSSFSCHAALISASTPGPAHQPCAPRGRLERVTNSAAVESMTSAMSVAMSLHTGAIGDWWQCVNHRVRNLASKVRVSHQPPKVDQLRVDIRYSTQVL